MKKIIFKTTLICTLLVLLICNICYADVVFLNKEDNMLLVFIKLLIMYIFLIAFLLYKKIKDTKWKKMMIILITSMLLIIDIAELVIIIDNNTIKTVLYGYVDQSDNFVIEPREYDYAENFLNGVAKIGCNDIYSSEYNIGEMSGSTIIQKYGYINIKGDIIIPAEYSVLSYFNDDGYSYGIKDESSIMPKVNFNDIEYPENREDLHFYKLDINGNKEEISYEQYVEEEKNTPKDIEFDKNIKLKEQINREYTDDIKYIIVPIIYIIISILILIKAFKEDKNNNDKEEIYEKGSN